MTHAQDGTIVAIRDSALVLGDARLHLEGCVTCQQELESARWRATMISETLDSLDTPVDMDRAKARVRERLDREHEAQAARPRMGRHLGRAAAVLLLTAGTIFALPRSPIRAWLTSVVQGSAEGPQPLVVDGQESLGRSGIEVVVGDRLRVTVTSASTQSPLEVVWIDGSVARIGAGAGSEYSFAEEHVQAAVTEGPVLIELPRDGTQISMIVNGAVLLERATGGELEVSGAVLSQDDTRIVFSIPES
jgi:hypothetical protein